MGRFRESARERERERERERARERENSAAEISSYAREEP